MLDGEQGTTCSRSKDCLPIPIYTILIRSSRDDSNIIHILTRGGTFLAQMPPRCENMFTAHRQGLLRCTIPFLRGLQRQTAGWGSTVS